jgi:hypothetical protein
MLFSPDVVHTGSITIHADQPDKVKILSKRGERRDEPKRFDGTDWYAGAILVVRDLEE